MTTGSDENTTSSTLAARSALLRSPIERSVAEFLLASGPRAAAMSAREIAQAIGTSDATVIRTSRSLGFEGFRDLRRFVASRAAEVPIEERLRKSLDAVEDPDAELRANIERQGSDLMAMAERIPESEFREANRIIARASHVWWSGVGPSAFVAEYAAFLFRRLGKDSGALTHAGFDGADELLSVKPGHAVIVLAYGRLHRHVRALLERAEAAGSDVIFVTDSVSLPSDQQVRVRLLSGRGHHGMFASHATTIVLVEALALSMAANQPAQARASVEQLNALRGAIAVGPWLSSPDDRLGRCTPGRPTPVPLESTSRRISTPYSTKAIALSGKFRCRSWHAGWQGDRDQVSTRPTCPVVRLGPGRRQPGFSCGERSSVGSCPGDQRSRRHGPRLPVMLPTCSVLGAEQGRPRR